MVKPIVAFAGSALAGFGLALGAAHHQLSKRDGDLETAENLIIGVPITGLAIASAAAVGPNFVPALAKRPMLTTVVGGLGGGILAATTGTVLLASRERDEAFRGLRFQPKAPEPGPATLQKVPGSESEQPVPSGAD